MFEFPEGQFYGKPFFPIDLMVEGPLPAAGGGREGNSAGAAASLSGRNLQPLFPRTHVIIRCDHSIRLDLVILFFPTIHDEVGFDAGEKSVKHGGSVRGDCFARVVGALIGEIFSVEPLRASWWWQEEPLQGEKEEQTSLTWLEL